MDTMIQKIKEMIKDGMAAEFLKDLEKERLMDVLSYMQDKAYNEDDSSKLSETDQKLLELLTNEVRRRVAQDAKNPLFLRYVFAKQEGTEEDFFKTLSPEERDNLISNIMFISKMDNHDEVYLFKSMMLNKDDSNSLIRKFKDSSSQGTGQSFLEALNEADLYYIFKHYRNMNEEEEKLHSKEIDDLFEVIDKRQKIDETLEEANAITKGYSYMADELLKEADDITRKSATFEEEKEKMWAEALDIINDDNRHIR